MVMVAPSLVPSVKSDKSQTIVKFVYVLSRVTQSVDAKVDQIIVWVVSALANWNLETAINEDNSSTTMTVRTTGFFCI
jgi:uncharacterized protein YtpQ (UPF0354 family)